MGLTLYAIFSNSLDLDLYSFVIGLDYANFSFIYNVPKNLLSPCTSCVSFTGYAFVQGDMNFLRMMGSIIELWILMGIVLVILIKRGMFEEVRKEIIWVNGVSDNDKGIS